MLRRNFVSLVSFAVWIACGGQGAMAQDEVADSEQMRGLEEVTVTARKRDESLQDTPLAISAFSNQDLVDMGATGLEDIAARSPGMQYAVQGGQFAGRGTTTIRFRGMDTLAGGPELATPFLDGVPMSGTVEGIGLQDLERIEVIRGPQSAFFGRATFAGAINYITRDPGDEYAGRISAEVASTGRYDVSMSHEGPILQDKLSYRISGRKYHRDGPFRSEVDGGLLGEENTESIAAALYFKPTENFSAKAQILYYENDDGSPAGGFIGAPLLNCWAKNGGDPLFTPPPGYTGVGPVDFFCGEIPKVRPGDGLTLSSVLDSVRGRELLFDHTGSPLWSDPATLAIYDDVPSLKHLGTRRESLRAHLKMTYTFPGLGWDLTSISGYNEGATHSVTDNDAEGVKAIFSSSANVSSDFFQELRLSSGTDQRLEWLIGLSYFKQDGKGAGYVWLPPFELFLRNSSSGSSTLIRTPAAFGALNYEFTGPRGGGVEGRYQEDEKDQGQTVTGASVKKTFTNFMPRAILQYEPNRSTNLYLTYAQGNRPGGFNTAVFALSDDEKQQLQDQVGGSEYVDEEELENFEFGWKQRLLDDRLYFDLAAYYMKWKNQQTRVQAMLYNPAHPNADPETGIRTVELNVAAGMTDLWGIELTADALVGDYGKVGMTFNWAASEFQDFFCVFPQRFTGGTDCAGNSTARYPEFSGSAYASYRRPVSDEWTGFIRGEVMYFGEAFTDESNLAWTPDYTTTALRLGSETDTYRVEFWVKNLFDSYFYVAGARQSSFSHGLNFNEQGVTVTPVVGRQIGLTAVYKF